MTTTFAPVSLPQLAAPDPCKHVNYELGMVLGVDDFVQEFAYGAARDQRIVRELIGHGVVSGLRVTVEVQADGPRVNVAPGEFVTPSGQFVCISPAQCASLNAWLAAHRDEVLELASPPPTELRLSVVACYAECLTDDVPIPGEPCRSDDELHRPSRVQDHFSLDLRVDAPPPSEADGVHEFVAWVRSIPVVDIPPGDVEAFLEELRQAVDADGASPPDVLFGSPPPSVQIPRAAAAEYLAALMGFWVSDLRARVGQAVPGAECGCGTPAITAQAAADCLRLADLTVPLVVDAQTGDVLVADTPAVEVRTDAAVRPLLLHLQILQELLLTTDEAAEAAPPAVLGRFASDGTTVAARGGLTATALDPTLFLLAFPAFVPGADYVVTGQAVAATADAQASTFEVIPDDDPDLAQHLGSPPAEGVVVRVRQGASDPVPGGFMVRIEEL